MNNVSVPFNAGEVILGNVSWLRIENLSFNDVIGIEIAYSSHIYIENNTCDSNKRYGILLYQSSNNRIVNNTFSNNKYGIYDRGNDIGIGFYKFGYNTIVNNTISNNNYGIYISSSYSNIYHNNILNNTNQVEDNGINNLWNYSYPSGGNFWSDYIGVDFNSTPSQDVPPPDGLGDTPYLDIQGFGGSGDIVQVWNELVYGPSMGGEMGPLFLANGNIIDWIIYLDMGGGLFPLRYGVDYMLYPLTGMIELWNYIPMGVGWFFYASYNHGVIEPSRDNYPLMMPIENKYIDYNITLSEGWNLISLPLIQGHESIHQVLDSIVGKWDYIQVYDSLDSDHWKTNATFKPDQLNDLKTLNHKIGFWINITEPNVNLTVKGYLSALTLN